MARDIKTRFVLEGEQTYKRAMSDAASAIKVLNSEQKLAEAQFEATGDAQQYAAEQARVLKEKIQEQKRIVEAAETAMKNFTNNGVDKNSRQVKNWQVKLNNAKGELLNMQTELNNVTEKMGTVQEAGDSQLEKISKGIDLQNTINAIDNVTRHIEAIIKAAAKAAKAVWDMGVDAGQWADNIATAANYAGVDPETYQSWQYASRFIDTNVDDIVRSWKDLDKHLDVDKKGDEFREFGAKMAKLGVGVMTTSGKVKDGRTVFWEVIDALHNMGSETDWAASALDLFGNDWRKLNPLITAGSQAYQDMANEGRAVAVVSNENVEALGAVDDAVQDMGARFDKLKYDTLAEMAPTFEKVAQALSTAIDALNEFVQSEEGQAALAGLNEALSGLIDAFLGEDNGKGTFESIVNGAKTAVTEFTTALTWIQNHGEEVETLVLGLAGAWAGLKVTKEVLQFAQLLSGAKRGVGGLFSRLFGGKSASAEGLSSATSSFSDAADSFASAAEAANKASEAASSSATAAQSSAEAASSSATAAESSNTSAGSSATSAESSSAAAGSSAEAAGSSAEAAGSSAQAAGESATAAGNSSAAAAASEDAALSSATASGDAALAAGNSATAAANSQAAAAASGDAALLSAGASSDAALAAGNAAASASSSALTAGSAAEASLNAATASGNAALTAGNSVNAAISAGDAAASSALASGSALEAAVSSAETAATSVEAAASSAASAAESALGAAASRAALEAELAGAAAARGLAEAAAAKAIASANAAALGASGAPLLLPGGTSGETPALPAGSEPAATGGTGGKSWLGRLFAAIGDGSAFTTVAPVGNMVNWANQNLEEDLAILEEARTKAAEAQSDYERRLPALKEGLKAMVETQRALEQADYDYYDGKVSPEELNEIIDKANKASEAFLAMEDSEKVLDAYNKWRTDNSINFQDWVLPKDWEQLGLDAGSGLAGGLDAGQKEVTEAGTALGQSAVDAAMAALDEHSPSKVMETIGGNAAVGLANGIYDRGDEAIRAAQWLADSVTNIVQSALEIHSPSRVFERLGAFTGEGFASGIEHSAEAVSRAVGTMIGATTRRPATSFAGVPVSLGGGSAGRAGGIAAGAAGTVHVTMVLDDEVLGDVMAPIVNDKIGAKINATRRS